MEVSVELGVGESSSDEISNFEISLGESIEDNSSTSSTVEKSILKKIQSK